MGILIAYYLPYEVKKSTWSSRLSGIAIFKYIQVILFLEYLFKKDEQYEKPSKEVVTRPARSITPGIERTL
jgi:hypothetical protein